MIISEISRSTAQRFRQSSTWVAILGFGFVWVPARLLAGVPLQRIGIWEFIVPGLFLAGHLALALAPWQWTGDHRSIAPLWRGCLQAIPWNAAWVFLTLWSLHDIIQPVRPSNPRPPPLLEDSTQPDHRRPRNPKARKDDPGDPPRPRESDRAEDRPLNPPPGLRQEVMILLLNMPFAMILGWFLAEKERAESSEKEMANLAQKAQTRALQAQLHPHALYNILGGLTELVHEDPDAAEEALLELVEMLRMLTRHGMELELPLGQERSLLRHYLTIEAIRLGARLQVIWEWPAWADDILLPPLLLQPLVENAVKHGISAHPAGGTIWIRAITSKRELLLEVENSGTDYLPKSEEGTGLHNLRERLQLMEKFQPSLDLGSRNGRTLAQLRLRNIVGACLG